jgi:surface antigen
VAKKSALKRLLSSRDRKCLTAVAIVLVLFVTGATLEISHAAGDPRDLPYVLGFVNQTLETERTQVPVPWSNPETGNSGTVVIERTFYPSPDTPCRDYRRTANLPGGGVAVIRGTGCRIGTSRWKLEEQEKPAIFSSPTNNQKPKKAAESSTPTTHKTAPEKASSSPTSGASRTNSKPVKSAPSFAAELSKKSEIKTPAPKPPAFPKYTQPSKTEF